jgi:hypothetical protein
MHENGNGYDRELAQKIARFWIDNGFAINWTVGKSGEDAKRCTVAGWPKTNPLSGELGSVAGQVAQRLKTRNPVTVLRASGLIGIECDSHEDVDHFLSFGAPATLTARSSEEWKRHFYFRAPEPNLPNAAFRFELGKITADAGRYLVTPPALHPSGVSYEWVNGDEIATLPLDVYTRLVEAASASRREQTKIAADPNAIITQGHRTKHIEQTTGSARRFGLPLEDAIAQALKINATRFGNEPLSETKVRETVAGIYNRYPDGIVAGTVPGSRDEPEDAPRSKTTSTRPLSEKRSSPTQARPDLTLVPLAEITMRSIRWMEKPLWQRSAFQLFAGAKGAGKGTYLAGLAARFSRRGLATLFISSEDSVGIDLKPRLVAAGAVIEHVFHVKEHVQLPDDIDELRRLVVGIDKLALIVIDPVANHIGALNSNSDAEVRDAIAPLNKLADELDCLIIGVRHPGKDRSRGAVASILGSTAWVDTPRAVVMVAVDDDDEDVRHVQVVAGNRSRNGSAQSFRIDEADVPGLEEPVTLAVELGESEKSVDELLSTRQTPGSKSAAARELILDILESEGDQESDEFDARVAREIGMSAGTVRNQRKVLRNEGLIKAHQEKDEFGGFVRWLVVRTSATRT